MSALALPEQAVNAVNEHPSRLTYPISPDYVKGWTAEMAVREFVANAWDDDRSFSYQWRDGVLTIEDQGPGIPEYGLVLGVSYKNKSQVGQFGEGLKIATLVLARNKNIGRVRVETVGYGFEPTIVNGSIINVATFTAHNGNGKTALLAYDFFECPRTTGTKVTIECSEELAAKVKRAFRFFEPGYKTPASPGVALRDNPGFIYVGGVLVQEKKDFVLGYDISLSDGKSLQNRDRTIIDGHELKRCVAEIVAQIDDPDLLEPLVRAALDGKLPEAERAFSTYGAEPGYRKAMREVAKRLFGGKKVCYRKQSWGHNAEHEDEAVLDLKDRGYTVLEAKIDAWQHERLMQLLGVKSAGDLFRKPSRKRDKQKTEWVDESKLSETQRANLERAVATVKALYGANAVGRVRVYSRTYLEQADTDLHWGGFYQPTNGDIGLQVGNLDDFDAALEVLIHETGHRLRHHERRWDYGDRTRGFEQTLVKMARVAASRLSEAGLLPTTLEEVAVLEAEKPKDPAALAADLLKARMQATGLKTYAALAEETGVTPHVARTIVQASTRGYRASPKPSNVRAVCGVLGLDWVVVWLTCSGVNVFAYHSRRKNGYLYGQSYVHAVEVVDALRERGDDKLADVVLAHAEGREPTSKDDDSWLEPYREAIAAEVARVEAGSGT